MLTLRTRNSLTAWHLAWAQPRRSAGTVAKGAGGADNIPHYPQRAVIPVQRAELVRTCKDVVLWWRLCGAMKTQVLDGLGTVVCVNSLQVVGEAGISLCICFLHL